ncbi:hypothetical protein R1flu_029061 [Riccia fluitans]|uniref:HTH CENPB-type domain-containing protein n=1 Tax=Riccia fluitans TaxID=41844 RepID=A0ABD1XP43_9MARC
MMISRILRKKEKYLTADLAPQEKRARKPECEDVEKLLYVWFSSMQERNVTLMDALVTNKAKEYYNSVIRQGMKEFKFSPGWLSGFKKRYVIRSYARHGEAASVEITEEFSPGWLSGFKKRYGMRSYARHGEAASVEITEEVAAKIQVLKELISQFDPDYVYNMDETGLFFRLEPGRTLATKKMSGKKASKERLTIALTCNMTDTDKLPPFVIHKYKKPHAFTKRNIRRLENLGIQWHSNAKAWMTIVLFEDFLVEFEKHVRLAGKEKVLLLLDNFAGHKVVSVQPYLNVTRLEFFPPNVTAVYQPMDCGIICAFKAHYRKYVIEKKLEKISQFQDPQIDIYEAVQMVMKAWSLDISSSTIRRCWRHSQLVNSNDILPDLNGDETVSDGIAELQRLLSRLQLENSPNDIHYDANEYVDFKNLSDVVQPDDLELEDLQELLVPSLYEKEPESDIVDSDQPTSLISSKEAIHALDIVQMFLEQSEENTVVILKQIEKIQKAIQNITANSLVQRDICSYFRSVVDDSQV